MKKVFFDNEKVLGVFTDRHGGVSKKPFDSLNLGFHAEDEFQDVLRNRKVILDELRIERLAWMNQIHSDTVKVVEEEGEVIMADAIVTRKKKLALMVMAADCCPILIHDLVQGVIAAVHAGREGTFKRIVQKTVEKMKEEFGCDPVNMKASIGPSIGPCCYEVNRSIIEKTYKEFDGKYIVNGKFLDIKTLNFDQLVETGLKKENIEVFEECSCCNRDYFSYRREGKTGRYGGIIMLR